jgi:hypothetical protein
MNQTDYSSLPGQTIDVVHNPAQLPAKKPAFIHSCREKLLWLMTKCGEAKTIFRPNTQPSASSIQNLETEQTAKIEGVAQKTGVISPSAQTTTVLQQRLMKIAAGAALAGTTALLALGTIWALRRYSPITPPNPNISNHNASQPDPTIPINDTSLICPAIPQPFNMSDLQCSYIKVVPAPEGNAHPFVIVQNNTNCSFPQLNPAPKPFEVCPLINDTTQNTSSALIADTAPKSLWNLDPHSLTADQDNTQSENFSSTPLPAQTVQVNHDTLNASILNQTRSAERIVSDPETTAPDLPHTSSGPIPNHQSVRVENRPHDTSNPTVVSTEPSTSGYIILAPILGIIAIIAAAYLNSSRSQNEQPATASKGSGPSTPPLPITDNHDSNVTLTTPLIKTPPAYPTTPPAPSTAPPSQPYPEHTTSPSKTAQQDVSFLNPFREVFDKVKAGGHIRADLIGRQGSSQQSILFEKNKNGKLHKQIELKNPDLNTLPHSCYTLEHTAQSNTYVVKEQFHESVDLSEPACMRIVDDDLLFLFVGANSKKPHLALIRLIPGLGEQIEKDPSALKMEDRTLHVNISQDRLAEIRKMGKRKIKLLVKPASTNTMKDGEKSELSSPSIPPTSSSSSSSTSAQNTEAQQTITTQNQFSKFSTAPSTSSPLREFFRPNNPKIFPSQHQIPVTATPPSAATPETTQNPRKQEPIENVIHRFTAMHHNIDNKCDLIHSGCAHGIFDFRVAPTEDFYGSTFESFVEDYFSKGQYETIRVESESIVSIDKFKFVFKVPLKEDESISTSPDYLKIRVAEHYLLIHILSKKNQFYLALVDLGSEDLIKMIRAYPSILSYDYEKEQFILDFGKFVTETTTAIDKAKAQGTQTVFPSTASTSSSPSAGDQPGNTVTNSSPPCIATPAKTFAEDERTLRGVVKDLLAMKNVRNDMAYRRVTSDGQLLFYFPDSFYKSKFQNIDTFNLQGIHLNALQKGMKIVFEIPLKYKDDTIDFNRTEQLCIRIADGYFLVHYVTTNKKFYLALGDLSSEQIKMIRANPSILTYDYQNQQFILDFEQTADTSTASTLSLPSSQEDPQEDHEQPVAAVQPAPNLSLTGGAPPQNS